MMGPERGFSGSSCPRPVFVFCSFIVLPTLLSLQSVVLNWISRCQPPWRNCAIQWGCDLSSIEPMVRTRPSIALASPLPVNQLAICNLIPSSKRFRTMARCRALGERCFSIRCICFKKALFVLNTARWCNLFHHIKAHTARKMQQFKAVENVLDSTFHFLAVMNHFRPNFSHLRKESPGFLLPRMVIARPMSN